MNIEDVLKLVRPNILGLEAYSTARDDCGSNQPEIFLDANENPYNNGINRYPDPHQKALKAKVAEIKGISADSLFIGNGSDEAIDLVYRVFCVPGASNAVSIAPSYGMYEVAAAMNDIEFRKVQLRPDFSMDTEAMLSAADSKTRLMFICSPNNPTGNSFPVEQIEDILERFGGVVVLDEAYIDFSVRPSLTSLVKRYPNLIVLQTLSKAWGMAGLRIGLAIADPAVIALMSKVKYPYNINVLAQKMALMKLDEAAKDKAVAEIVGQRFRLEKNWPNARRSREYIQVTLTFCWLGLRIRMRFTRGCLREESLCGIVPRSQVARGAFASQSALRWRMTDCFGCCPLRPLSLSKRPPPVWKY